MPASPDFTHEAPSTERHLASRHLHVLRRRLPIILICLVLTPAIAVAYSLSKPTEYTASSGLLFRTPDFSQSFGSVPFFTPTIDPARQAATNLRLVSLPVVSQNTANKIDHG